MARSGQSGGRENFLSTVYVSPSVSRPNAVPAYPESPRSAARSSSRLSAPSSSSSASNSRSQSRARSLNSAPVKVNRKANAGGKLQLAAAVQPKRKRRHDGEGHLYPGNEHGCQSAPLDEWQTPADSPEPLVLASSSMGGFGPNDQSWTAWLTRRQRVSLGLSSVPRSRSHHRHRHSVAKTLPPEPAGRQSGVSPNA
jgi:hypothetical protein